MGVKRKPVRNSRHAGTPADSSAISEWMQHAHPEWVSLESWATWREKCALDLCTADIQMALKGFILFQFRRFLNRLAAQTNAPQASRELSMQEAWHLFETHVAVRQTREGKRYKDWLFARTWQEPEAAARIVVAGATLLARDALRELLRREFSPAAALSMNQPLHKDHPAGPCLEDCLPGSVDPSHEVALRELEEAARRHAEEWFAALGRRERLILLARFSGLTLAHPLIEQLVGCRKSKACLMLRETVEKIAAQLKGEYPEDDAAGVRLLTGMTLQEIRSAVSGWAEKDAAGVELLRAAERM